MTDRDEAAVLLEQAAALARHSEEPGLLVRRSFSPALRRVHDDVTTWMRAAGMQVHEDAAGNLLGRYDGAEAGARTLILGSHLDTVRDAGSYDGPLGVLAALACVYRLHRQQRRLPYAIEVIAFADEEGLRFGASYLGSSAVAGTFEPAWLELLDADGMSLAQAMRAFGGDPQALQTCQKDPRDLLGYCEVHIEQGPVLEAHGLPVGVVDSIAGQSRLTLTFSGHAGHAGTVPMSLRHDALCAAAEFVLAAERLGRETKGLVATVGSVEVHPGASNVIPGQVTLSLDVRHQHDAVLERKVETLREEAQSIAHRRGIAVTVHVMQVSPSVPCAPLLSELLGEAIAASSYPIHRLSSGAGHDAVALSAIMPVAMLFVRCAGGISHHPDESVSASDVAVALDVLERFLSLLADRL